MDSAEPDELFLAQVDGDPMVDKEEGTHDARLVLQPDLAMEIASGRISEHTVLRPSCEPRPSA
jgi:hypothetical protein